MTYKSINPKKVFTKEEFISTFKPEFFNDESAQITYFDYVINNKSKFSKQLPIQVFIDFVTQNNISNTVQATDDNKATNLNDASNKQQILYFFKNLDIKTSSAGTFFEKIDIKNINQYGYINIEHISSHLRMKYKSDEIFVSNFCQYFKTSINTLVDLQKMHGFIMVNCENASLVGDITTIVDILKNTIRNNYPNKTVKDAILNIYNLKLTQLFTLQDTCNYIRAIFNNISVFECISLFNELVNSEENIFKDERKFSFDFFLKYFKLDSEFEPMEEEKKMRKIDPYLIQSLQKLSNYLITQTDSLALFNKLDTDNSGVLSREEFLKFLNNLDLDINDSQKILILKYADTNNDDQINYIEFLELIGDIGLTSSPRTGLKTPKVNPVITNNSNKTLKESKVIKENEKQQSKKDMIISKKASKIRKNIQEQLKLNYNQLKENYENNLLIDNKNPFENINFILQEELYKKFYDDKNMIKELEVFSQEELPPFVIPQSDFFVYLQLKGN